MIKQIIPNVLLIFCLLVGINGRTQPLYPRLEKGKYDVGYRTIFDFDFSRRYNLKFPADIIGKSDDPRPILIELWYPISLPENQSARSMKYGDYINVKSKTPLLETFVERINEYNAKNSSLYMTYNEELSVAQETQLHEHLDQAIDVNRNAKPIDKKFPLIIYHPGLGGTLNDNTILCEYLASNGYVVMSGAFQSSDYKSVNLNWDLERSTKDMDFMLNSIKELDFVDFKNIAAIGHSYGAQAILSYGCEDSSPISCLLIIDSTVDYSPVSEPDGFGPLVEKIYRKNKNLTMPMLVFAKPTAMFTVMDSLKFSDRTYCTTNLRHQEFTSLTAFAILHDLINTDQKDSIWDKYLNVNQICLMYLNDHFYGTETLLRYSKTEESNIELMSVPKGKKLGNVIPEYEDKSIPPTSPQFEIILANKDKNTILQIIDKFPNYLHEDRINNLGYNYFDSDIDFALKLFNKNVELHPESWNVWDSLGEAYAAKNETQLAIKYYQKSIELNPNNQGGIEMIEILKNRN